MSGKDYLTYLEKTGYCWRCGKPCKPDKLFCGSKHEEQYIRMKESEIHKGKKAGYGAAGSTH